MRTRIALTAITSIAIITVSILTQAATMQSARAGALPSFGTNPSAGSNTTDRPLLDLGVTLFADGGTSTTSATAAPAPAVAPVPAVTAAVAGPVDTVTPAQRAAWERVAMCEEGGNWAAGGSRFSGGLGITRANWSAFGGQQFAPVGALATEDQQIMVAERIQFNPPDQYGCHAW
jgi:hypothetical protein